MKLSKPSSTSIGLLFLLIACVNPIADAKSGGDFYENLSRLNKVLFEVNTKYVEEVDPSDITEAAVEGLHGVLDPHTAMFTPEDYSDLKVSTDGEFGGLGITISIREDWLTVITPLQGTPAFKIGLQAGDKIVKIDGESTEGITVDDAVGKLRGKIGTEVTISVAREGFAEELEFVIERGKIIIHSVPFSGMVESGVGYIKVAQFSKTTGDDVRDAIVELQSQGMKKLILDLRYNPGGLLNQAIEVSDLFLDKGKTIVSTKGRTQETEARAENDPLLPKDVPLVVLVNGGSASASEIVSGAIQDWDRGVILGKTTFGKGSVQTIYPLDNAGHALKLTTAFYYLPHGRCINKPENGLKIKEQANDSIAKDSSHIKFSTANGRVTYGSGGINPDIDTDGTLLNWYQQLLERNAMFFKFAVKYRPELDNQKVEMTKSWQVPKKVIKAFNDYVSQDTIFAKSKTGSETVVNMLNEVVVKENEALGIDSTAKDTTEVGKAIKALESALKSQRTQAFDQNRTYIERALKREFLSAYLGDKASTSYMLQYDKQIQEALAVLKDEKRYQKILTEGEPQPKPTEDTKTKKSK